MWCCRGGSFHDWRVDEWGTKTATGAATDAEQDIAVMLIFAQHLVDAGPSVRLKTTTRTSSSGCCHPPTRLSLAHTCTTAFPPSCVGAWQPHTTPQGATYGQRAQRMLDAMWDLGMIQDAK